LASAVPSVGLATPTMVTPVSCLLTHATELASSRHVAQCAPQNHNTSGSPSASATSMDSRPPGSGAAVVEVGSTVSSVVVVGAASAVAPGAVLVAAADSAPTTSSGPVPAPHPINARAAINNAGVYRAAPCLAGAYRAGSVMGRGYYGFAIAAGVGCGSEGRLTALMTRQQPVPAVPAR